MPKRVVVTNYSPNVLLLYKTILEANGYEVVVWTPETVTIDTLAALAPDLVIVDISGVDLNELSLLHQVQEHPRLQFIPLIISTASVMCVLSMEGLPLLKNISLLTELFDYHTLVNFVQAVLPSAQ